MTENPEHYTSWIARQTTTNPPIALSIIVPAFNEERRLPPTLIDMVDYLDRTGDDYEIIVVDDGSADRTSEVVRKFERVRSCIKLIQLPRNYGKGHAVRLGVLNSRGTRVLFADADGSTPIQELSRLSAALDRGADIAIGSRALASSETKVETSVHRRCLGRVFNWCVNVILLPDIADTQCGFKMFSRQSAMFLFKHQRSDRFSFDVEILFLARKADLRIEEVAINWTNVAGSKVNLITDALSMFRDIFRFRVMHRGITPESFVAFKDAEAAPSYS
jgi:dolichyl-phosphate beta-glucosyltransferase